jgi:uncharacterized domain HDIG
MPQHWEKAMSAEEARAAMKSDASPEREVGEGSVTASIRDELRRVDGLYGQAIGYARKFIDDVRAGKPFDFSEATPLVNGFIDSVFRNESAAAAIGRLKSFDEYTYTHCINVSILAVILGRKLGYAREKLEVLGIAGLFHDVGKATIPEAILNKPGKLTDEEMAVMRTHPLRGYKLLREQKDIPVEVLRGCLEHHEKHDGSGYPRGLKGDAISDYSRLLAVVDVYDALTSRRVYKEPMPPGKVLGMMYTWRVTDFHPNIVEQFIKSLGVYPVGSLVRLSSGDHAVVVDHNPAAPLSPLVRIAFDQAMRPIGGSTQDLSGRDDDLKITDVINPDDHQVDVYSFLR